MIGQTLLHYRITDRLGAGGMGEVYRATDTNLNRDVAIKVLPPEVTQDEERLGRFRREAHLLASLNHPNIATIHGLEEANGQPFLVLELVEGEDLKERLDRGAIPLDEALEIARQVAEALEEAHAHGIVHRDLKPANIKLTPEGKVKVLDFGLAKAWAGDTASGTSSLDLSAPPTLAQSGTLAGVILGTAAYMSPEQANGRTVDKRADIWSFGVLLFEMLSGQRLFTGETASEILASVIKEEPAWERLPAACPNGLRKVLRRCLRKKVRERLQDIGDARLELQELGGAEGERGHEVGAEPWPREERARWGREFLVWSIALALGIGAGLTARRGCRGAPGPQTSGPLARLAIEVPAEVPLTDACASVSPDGRHIAVVPNGATRGLGLWVLSLDGRAPRRFPLQTKPCPFWSPDGSEVAYAVWTEGRTELRSTHLEGGGAQTLARVESPNWTFGGATWGREGRIVFSVDGTLYTVSHSGGEPAVFLEPDASRGEHGLFAPQLLPDERSLLYSVGLEGGAERWMTTLGQPDRGRRILPGVNWAQYVDSGQLLYARDGELYSQPFDVERGELAGSPARLHSVAMHSRFGGGLFSVSPSGVLAYIQGGDPLMKLTWFDRDGTQLETLAEPEPYQDIRLSPDDGRVATTIAGAQRDIWTIDVARGVATPEISSAQAVGAPLWSPDGKELYLQLLDDSAFRPHRKRLDSQSPPQLLLESPANAFVESVSPDSATLLYLSGNPPLNSEIHALSLAGDGETELLLKGDHSFDGVEISPDGRWLAYISDETGDWEVYIAPFRREGRAVRTSPQGGRQPQWRGDSRELYYVTSDGRLMSIQLEELDGRLRVGAPTLLFEAGVSSPYSDEYDVTRDGQRFLVMTPSAESKPSLKIMLNWAELLK